VIATPAAGYGFTAATLARVVTPVQLWEAGDDRVTPNRWNGDLIKTNLPSPPQTHLVPLAGHFSFLAPCSAVLAEQAAEICRDGLGFDRAGFHDRFNPAVAEFLASTLKRDSISGSGR
jgi:predicted dienelactone hydrolase